MEYINEKEMASIAGGNPLVLAGMFITSYSQLLNKMENNPEDYTFLMDWYYE